MKTLWRDQSGAGTAAEVVFVATIVVLGVVAGAKSVRDSLVTELADYGQAIGNLDQSYNVPDSEPGLGDGSGYIDQRDFCDDPASDEDGPSQGPKCIIFGAGAAGEGEFSAP